MAIENLIENVDSQIIKIRTKSLDVSFNELYDMYKNGELTISPDYQRLFRWEEEKQSRFIESLILEMPVPPIFVIETGDGIYELIDGLQRISSYLHFRGEHLDRSTTEPSDSDEVKANDETNGSDTIAFASLIDKLVDHKVPSEIVEKVNEIKFSDELKSYKTGSVNGVKTRIKLFTEGVQDILDGR